jgi:hypothetical protein
LAVQRPTNKKAPANKSGVNSQQLKTKSQAQPLWQEQKPPVAAPKHTKAAAAASKQGKVRQSLQA